MAYRLLGQALVDRYRNACERCGHEWESIGDDPPKSCAACKSRYWNTKRGKLKMGRPPTK